MQDIYKALKQFKENDYLRNQTFYENLSESQTPHTLFIGCSDSRVSPEQQEIAEASKAALDQSGRYDKPIVVPITKASEFYEAEEYHQDFYKKDPEHYARYSQGSGRVAFIEKHKA